MEPNQRTSNAVMLHAAARTDTQLVEQASPIVFISYSRKDIVFCRQLASSLERHAISTRIDFRDLPTLEEWQRELVHLISEADTVVFVISQNSIASPVCAWEVEQVVRLGKRLAPIVLEQVDNDRIPSDISRINYLFFNDTSTPFEEQVARLAQALTQDIDWLKEHTRLSTLATRWSSTGRGNDLLLRGSEITAFERWQTRRPASAPPVTPGQDQYLTESRRLDDARVKEQEALISRLRRTSGLAFLPGAKSSLQSGRYDCGMRSAMAGALLAEDPSFSLHPELLRAGIAALSSMKTRSVFWHDPGIASAAVSKDSTVIALAALDGAIYIHSIADAALTSSIPPGSGSVLRLQFNKNGTTLLILTQAEALIYSVDRRKANIRIPAKGFRFIDATLFDDVNRIVASLLIDGSSFSTEIFVYDIRDGRRELEISKRGISFRLLSADLDGQRQAITSDRMGFDYAGPTKGFELLTPLLPEGFNSSQDDWSELKPRLACLDVRSLQLSDVGLHHANQITSSAFATKYDILVAGSDDRTISAWSLLQWRLAGSVSGMAQAVKFVDVSPDNERLLALSGNQLGLFNLQKEMIVAQFGFVGAGVTACVFNRTGKYAAIGFEDGHIDVVVAKDGRCVSTITENSSAIKQLGFICSGHGELISLSEDGTLKQFDWQNGRSLIGDGFSSIATRHEVSGPWSRRPNGAAPRWGRAICQNRSSLLYGGIKYEGIASDAAAILFGGLDFFLHGVLDESETCVLIGGGGFDGLVFDLKSERLGYDLPVGISFTKQSTENKKAILWLLGHPSEIQEIGSAVGLVAVTKGAYAGDVNGPCFVSSDYRYACLELSNNDLVIVDQIVSRCVVRLTQKTGASLSAAAWLKGKNLFVGFSSDIGMFSIDADLECRITKHQVLGRVSIITNIENTNDVILSDGVSVIGRFDILTGRYLWIHKLDQGALITCLDGCVGDNVVVAGMGSGTILLLSSQDGTPIATWEGYLGAATDGVCLSPSGKMVGAFCKNGSVFVFDTSDGAMLFARPDWSTISWIGVSDEPRSIVIQANQDCRRAWSIPPNEFADKVAGPFLERSTRGAAQVCGAERLDILMSQVPQDIAAEMLGKWPIRRIGSPEFSSID